MKKIIKKPIFIFVSIFVFFGSIFLIKELPKENNVFQKANIRFRFNLGPRRGYYYRDYHYRGYYYNYGYTRVELEVKNVFNKEVSDVHVDGHLIIGDRSGIYPNIKSFTLRPGNHTITWRVRSKFSNGYKTYRENIRVYSEDNYVYIMIRGDKIYID